MTVAGLRHPKRAGALLMSAGLHFLGFSPFAVLPAAAGLEGVGTFTVVLALIGVTAAGGLISVFVGSALDRYGAIAVASIGLGFLALGYAGLVFLPATPAVWLCAGAVLGIGVQATGGQTAFYVLRTGRPDAAAQGHFISNLGISAAGIVLPWLVAVGGMLAGLRGAIASIAAMCAVVLVLAWRVARRQRSRPAEAQQPKPIASAKAFSVMSRVTVVAVGFGVLASSSLLFSTALAASAKGNVTVAAAFVACVSAGAAIGRLAFAIALSPTSTTHVVNRVALICFGLQVAGCFVVAFGPATLFFGCVGAVVYGLGSSGSLALLPVALHRQTQGLPQGVVLGQARLVMTPFQVATIAAVGGIAANSTTKETFLGLAVCIATAALAVGIAEVIRYRASYSPE